MFFIGVTTATTISSSISRAASTSTSSTNKDIFFSKLKGVEQSLSDSEFLSFIAHHVLELQVEVFDGSPLMRNDFPQLQLSAFLF